jgi:hypothetical protein
MTHKYIDAATDILKQLGFPRAQLNERSALVLLAVLDMTPTRKWRDAGNPLIGITPIMDWAFEHYQKQYKPNTRESVRRQTMHQFMQAGLVLYNPDDPTRAVNSPRAVYQVSRIASAPCLRLTDIQFGQIQPYLAWWSIAQRYTGRLKFDKMRTEQPELDVGYRVGDIMIERQ